MSKRRLVEICYGKHDVNLLALAQEVSAARADVRVTHLREIGSSAYVIDRGAVPADCAMVLHPSAGGTTWRSAMTHMTTGRLLNRTALSYPDVGDKLWQQKQVAAAESRLAIETRRIAEVSAAEVDFPVIVKPARGTCGEGVRIVVDSAGLADQQGDQLVVQPYVRNHGDWRVVVIGGRAVSAIRRHARPGVVTNNIATGGFAYAERDGEILGKVFGVAEQVASILKFDYVGIDVIQDLDDGSLLFLEANEFPTFETSQILTGVNIASVLVGHLLDGDLFE